MRPRFGCAAASALIAGLLLAGCTPTGAAPQAGDPASMLVSQAEASAHGGWTVSAANGPVDGDTSDCTGAPYDWPHIKTEAHASQFLHKGTDDSISVIIKRLNGKADLNIKAVRAAVAPCAPSSGARRYGAMIKPVGDDSFAYQSEGEDESGRFVLDDTLVACGSFEMEAVCISYSQTFDQAGLESLLSSAITRMLKAGNCT